MTLFAVVPETVLLSITDTTCKNYTAPENGELNNDK